MWATLCGDRQSLWVDANMSFWITHFYISKYYEFVDSWIIVLKGRDPIFLQTYHHAGVVLIMWALTVTHSSPVIVLVFLNSFIHTLMYTYYTAAALGYPSPLKHYLTQMQLLQFIVGIGVTVPTHFIKDSIGEPVLNRAQAFSLLCLQVYTIILIGLFGQFYYQSYVVSKNKKRKD